MDTKRDNLIYLLFNSHMLTEGKCNDNYFYV